MAKTQEVVINGTVYIISHMDAEEELYILGDLQKELLPSLGAVLGGFSDDASDEDMVNLAMQHLSPALSGDMLKRWSTRLLTKDSIAVEINGNVVPLDAATKALAYRSFTDPLELLVRTILVRFKDPLAGWLGQLGLDPSRLKAAQSELTDQK